MKKPNLLQLQKWFKGILIDREDQPELPSWIKDRPQLTARQQLQVHRTNRFLSHTAKLMEDFPALYRLLGTEKFNSLIEEYFKEFPSKSPFIHSLGENLTGYLTLCSEDSRLIELARFEWELVRCTQASERTAMNTEKLRDVPGAVWSQAQIVLNPDLRLLNFSYAVDQVWEEEDPQIMKELMKQNSPRRILIYPFAGEARFSNLDSARFRLLSLFKQGYDIGSALTEMQTESFKPDDLMVWISDWIQSQVIVDIEVSVAGCD